MTRCGCYHGGIMIRSINPAAIVLVVALSFLPCLAQWKQIGLAGKEVTALVSVVIPPADTLLIAGTRSDGVWARRNSGQFQLLDNLGSVRPSSFLKGITNFHVHPKSYLLFAGTDSGLCAYPLVSMIEPMWIKVKTGAETFVTDIVGTGDTLFCCTPSEVYRSLNSGTAWEPCSARTFLPMLGNITSFTSLAFCWGINAGSKFSGALNSWMGVMNSTDLGAKWHDISVLPPTQTVGQVFDLVAYRTRFDAKQRLLAATNEGLKYVEGDLDTGCWYPLDPQFKAMTPKSVHVSYFSRSFISEFWVAGDSGVYVLSDRINAVGWARLYDKKSNCVIADAAVDPQRWFAGTGDGIWMFPGKDAGVAPRGPDQAVRRVTGNEGKAFTLDGRQFSPGNRTGARRVAVIRIGKK
jgi:hypothetical protein